LLAGGTGLTPIYSLMHALQLTKDQSIEIKMIYSNKTEDDILLKQELSELTTECPNIKITHALTRVPAEKMPGWARSGRVTWEMMKDLDFPEPGEETLIAFCGRPDFNKMLLSVLSAHGYTDSMIFKF
jgi:NAD(P)H-flavin reductase